MINTTSGIFMVVTLMNMLPIILLVVIMMTFLTLISKTFVSDKWFERDDEEEYDEHGDTYEE